MLRNVGGQAIGSQVNAIATGAPFTGEVKVYVTGDGGVQALGAINGGVCVPEGNGYFSYAPSQAETNYTLIAFTFIGSGSIPSTVQVVTVTEAQAAAIASATITTIIGDGPTRVELLNQLAHRLNKTPMPHMDPATEARLGSYLNQRQRRLLSMPGLARLRDGALTFTSIADQPHYGLASIAKVQRIYERTNDRVLYEMSKQDYRLYDPNPTSGTPEAYVWTGRAVVQRQPAGPTSLWLWSSNVSDVSTVVYIEGVAGGIPRAVSVTLTGTTPVNIANTIADWTRIDKFYLSAPCRGDITLGDDPATPTLALGTIIVGAVMTEYTGLTLWPTPSDAFTYYVDVVRAVTDLVHDTDQAALPVDFADLLVLGALADEYQHLADPRWSTAITEYKERENQLKYWLAETAIGRPFQLSGARPSSSQLGSWYPAGS